MTAGTSARLSAQRYTRVVSTEVGGSAFEDAELLLAEQEVAGGVPPLYVGGLGAAPAVAFVDFEAFDTAPHPANGPQWVVMLRGAIEVEVTDGATRRFGPGDLVLATDTTGSGHITRTVDAQPYQALIIPTTFEG